MGHSRLARASRDEMKALMETQDSPQILVKRAQKGERDAFDALVLAYKQELGKHARTRIGDHLRSKVEVEDIPFL